jgi:hypothetical protein
MATLEQVRNEARRMGAPITPRTFWRYVELRLLPQGQKYPGMGNVFYFPDDTPERIVQIQTLKKGLGIPLHRIQKSLLYWTEDQPWDKTVVKRLPSAFDLMVWWAGVMARLRIVNKPTLEEEDFPALFARLKPMFEAFGAGRGEPHAEQETRRPATDHERR